MCDLCVTCLSLPLTRSRSTLAHFLFLRSGSAFSRPSVSLPPITHALTTCITLIHPSSLSVSGSTRRLALTARFLRGQQLRSSCSLHTHASLLHWLWEAYEGLSHRTQKDIHTYVRPYNIHTTYKHMFPCRNRDEPVWHCAACTRFALHDREPAFGGELERVRPTVVQEGVPQRWAIIFCFFCKVSAETCTRG